MVTGAFSLLSVVTGKVSGKDRMTHFEENERFLESRRNNIHKAFSYIENQEMWGLVRFGAHKKSNMAYSGCEIIATYNALISLGNRSYRITDLIKHYEKSGAALRGGFGIAPSAPARFFEKKGYKVRKTFSREKEKIDSFGEQNATFLVTFYWDKEDASKQLHTVNISKSPEGFIVHNAYQKNAEGVFIANSPKSTLGEAIYSIAAKVSPIVIYGIS